MNAWLAAWDVSVRGYDQAELGGAAPIPQTAEELLAGCTVWPTFIWNGERWFMRVNRDLYRMKEFLTAQMNGEEPETVDSFGVDEPPQELLDAVRDWNV